MVTFKLQVFLERSDIMVVWSDRIKKVISIFNSVGNELLKDKIDIDGIIEIFNDGIEQGGLLKVYDKYAPELDYCIWAYLPKERDCNNQMRVLIGYHTDCKENNTWSDNVKSTLFTQNRASELHDEVRDYIINFLKSNINKEITIDEKMKEK